MLPRGWAGEGVVDTETMAWSMVWCLFSSTAATNATMLVQSHICLVLPWSTPSALLC